MTQRVVSNKFAPTSAPVLKKPTPSNIMKKTDPSPKLTIQKQVSQTTFETKKRPSSELPEKVAPPKKIPKIETTLDTTESPSVTEKFGFIYNANSLELSNEQIQALQKIGYDLNGAEIGVFETKQGKNTGKVSIFINKEWACHADDIKMKPKWLAKKTAEAKAENERKWQEENGFMKKEIGTSLKTTFPVKHEIMKLLELNNEHLTEIKKLQERNNYLQELNNAYLKNLLKMKKVFESPECCRSDSGSLDDTEVVEESQVIG